MIGVGVGVALGVALAYAGSAAAAPPKAGAVKPGDKPVATAGDAGSPSWVADELRILRSEVESLRQRPDSSVAGEVAALRAEVAKLAAAQADLDRRLGGVPPSAASDAAPASGMGMTGAVTFLGLGFALGWVGSQLAHRWRDRRQRIRL